MSTRDVLTLSNLAAIPTAWKIAKNEQRLGLALVQLLACALSLAFHATEADSVNVFGISVEHGVDGGFVVPALVPKEFLAAGVRNSALLLCLDELGALLAVCLTTAACGGPKHTVRIIIGSYRSLVLLGLASLAVSDLMLSGWPHALLHALWHIIAFSLPQLLVSKARATHAEKEGID